jgi:hypothetical protein
MSSPRQDQLITSASLNSLNEEFMSSITDFLSDTDFVNLAQTEKKYFTQFLFIQEIVRRAKAHKQGYGIRKLSDPASTEYGNRFVIFNNGKALVQHNSFYSQRFPRMPKGLSLLPVPLSRADIIDMTGNFDVLTKSGDVYFLNYLEHVAWADIKYAVNLHHFYPAVHIKQALYYMHRTYLVSDQGLLYQPEHKNKNGDIVIELKQLSTITYSGDREQEHQLSEPVATQHLIKKIFPTTRHELFLLTQSGRVLLASIPNGEYTNASPKLLNGTIESEVIIDLCVVAQMNLFLTQSGKLYCHGKDIQGVFAPEHFPNIPNETEEPILIEALSEYVITEIKPGSSMHTYGACIYFKDDQKRSFAIGNNNNNKLVSDEFIAENQPAKQINIPQEIIDAKINVFDAWYLTEDGLVYHADSSGSLTQLTFNSKALSIDLVRLGMRGNHFKLYVTNEDNGINIYDSCNMNVNWENLDCQSQSINISKTYNTLTKFVSALGHHSFFNRAVEHLTNAPVLAESQPPITRAYSY